MEDMNNNVVETGVVEETNTEEVKTYYTADEVAKLIQAEADRRTNQALAKQKKHYEKQLSLSSLDEQQRKEAEAQMTIEDLRNQLAQFQLEKNRSELKSVLASRSLDVRFADIINITDDLEQSQQNIDTLDRLFKAAVKAEVEKRLAGSTPKGNGGRTGEITKDSAKKMSLAELAQLKKTNPELYHNLYN